MSVWTLGIIGIALLFVALYFLRGGADVEKWAHHAAHTGNLDLLLRHIETSNPHDTASTWNQAIDILWQNYHRDTAGRLVVEAAKRTDAPIVQYWIQRFREVEPEIAARHFSPEFLAEYFRPDVAAKCGRSCGCG